jgi:hypothetical protein
MSAQLSHMADNETLAMSLIADGFRAQKIAVRLQPI